MVVQQHHIELYKSLFRGRNDLYAIKWEKIGGYMPAYKVDWSNYQKQKAQGGTFKNYADKTNIPFDDLAIENQVEDLVDRESDSGLTCNVDEKCTTCLLK